MAQQFDPERAQQRQGRARTPGTDFPRQAPQGARMTAGQRGKIAQLLKTAPAISGRRHFPGRDQGAADQTNGVLVIHGAQHRFHPGLGEGRRSQAAESQQAKSRPFAQQLFPELIECFVVFRGPPFELVEHDQGRLGSQRLPEVVEGLPQGRITSSRPVPSFGQQLPA